MPVVLRTNYTTTRWHWQPFLKIFTNETEIFHFSWKAVENIPQNPGHSPCISCINSENKGVISDFAPFIYMVIRPCNAIILTSIIFYIYSFIVFPHFFSKNPIFLIFYVNFFILHRDIPHILHLRQLTQTSFSAILLVQRKHERR